MRKKTIQATKSATGRIFLDYVVITEVGKRVKICREIGWKEGDTGDIDVMNVIGDIVPTLNARRI